LCVEWPLSKFLVVRVSAARSNLIWLYMLVEGLRSDATVTVTPRHRAALLGVSSWKVTKIYHGRSPEVPGGRFCPPQTRHLGARHGFL
jgi:hypothetical protein